MGKNRIICDSTLACLVVQSGKTVVTFNKRTGWIDYLDIDGKPMLEKGYAIRPDFWRAPTDKDYGAGCGIEIENDLYAGFGRKVSYKRGFDC